MSAVDHRQMSIELDATEMLRNAMVGRPVAEYLEDIQKLTEEEVNAINSTGRTMLHQAVILGKADWTRELLEAGANQMLKDGDGQTALQLAEEMLSKHAGDKERKDLLDIMLDRPSDWSGNGSFGSSGDVGASIGTRKLVLKLEESLESDFSNISTQLNVIRESHDSMKVKLNAVQNSREEIKDELNAMKVSLSDLGNTSMQAINDLRNQFNPVKNSQDEMKDGLNSVKKSLEGVKGEVTTTVDNLKSQIQKFEIKVDGIIPMIVSLHREAFREYCIEGLMGKTIMLPSNEENKLKMRKLYEMMYDRDSILSSILQVIRLQSVEVHVDFTSGFIGGMKPTLRDHDGRERSGDDFTVFADFEERKAYVDGKFDRDDNIISRLALALSQLCVLLAFGNKGLPYSEDEERERELYKGILEEAERKKRDGEELDWWIESYALDNSTTHMGMEIILHATVPAIIARYGSSGGRSKMRKHLPSLLAYFEDHVVRAMREEKQWRRWLEKL